ncbi:MAG: asparagine synthase (glutamine-hydrolyzing) [Gemmatimonadota bacterium]
MCGFAGALERQPGSSGLARVEQAMQCLLRRGPDAGGAEVLEVAGWTASLGHRRLRIIDLDDRSAQPFHRGALTLLFNGEVYNYVELRQELEALGATFRTTSDTEVVAAAWEAWGHGAFARFDGMFALAIVDAQHDVLILARDAFGEKPLFVSATPDRVAFGSTADAVLAMREGEAPVVSQAFISAFVTLGFVPAPLTVWEGMEKLAAGEIRQLDLRSGAWQVTHVAAVDAVGPSGTDRFDIVAFETLMTESLSRRLRADVPLALLLSGGIDSAYIAALMRRSLQRDVLAVTIHDRIDSTEEIDRAARVCRTLGIEHRLVRMPVRPLAAVIADALPAMDEPIGDPAFPMLCELYAHVPPELRVVLTGDGADELFLSYSSFRRMLTPGRGIVGVAGAALRGVLGTGWARGTTLRRRVSERLAMDASLDPGERFRLLGALAGWEDALSCAGAPSIMPRGAGPAALYRHSLAHELPEYLLMKADRASMLHSFESRTPYLSMPLLRYVLACSPASVDLGHKRHITTRLETLLGEDLSFTKRGFFASGQEQLERAGRDWHPALRRSRHGVLLAAAQDRRRVDALTYYRLHVLHEWLVLRCA